MAKAKTRQQIEAEDHERFLTELRSLVGPEERARLIAMAAVSDNALLVKSAMEMMNDFLGAKKEEPQLVPIFALPPDFNPDFQPPKPQVKEKPNADRSDQPVPAGVEGTGGVGSSNPDPLGLGLGSS